MAQAPNANAPQTAAAKRSSVLVNVLVPVVDHFLSLAFRRGRGRVGSRRRNGIRRRGGGFGRVSGRAGMVIGRAAMPLGTDTGCGSGTGSRSGTRRGNG